MAVKLIRMKPPGYNDTVWPETAASIVRYNGYLGYINVEEAIDKTIELKQAMIGTLWEGASPPYTQTIAVNGIDIGHSPVISPLYSPTLATAMAQKEAWNMVSKIETGANALYVTCFEEKPTVAIPIQIKGV